jgi:UDP-N-acetylglucosamine 4,6-dehydratase (inverting)
MFNDKTVLITGGTGSFGTYFTEYLLQNYNPGKIIIYSRDEFKQFTMRNNMMRHDHTLRFFIGDVRDRDRLRRAFNGVDYVVHAAAMKQVPACEYNPIEAIRTNIEGAINVIDAAIDRGVKKVVALSTDKAVSPVNLYGGTKFVSDKLFVSANAYSGGTGTVFSIVRYGNVAGSRGSVIPFFRKLLSQGEQRLPITDFRMTRFWIDLKGGVELVIKALLESRGGETYISKIPSFKIIDLAEAMAPGCELREVGVREGEKMHEVMVGVEDSLATYEFDKHYLVCPQLEWWSDDGRIAADGRKVGYGFEYNSGTNTEWLNVGQLRELVRRVEEENAVWDKG